MVLFDPLAYSCLIHRQIRALWVPATKSCAITNVEVCRDFYINLLATDIILLFIMLVRLVRPRLSAGVTLYISHLLWKQVGHCQFLLVLILLSHCN